MLFGLPTFPLALLHWRIGQGKIDLEFCIILTFFDNSIFMLNIHTIWYHGWLGGYPYNCNSIMLNIGIIWKLGDLLFFSIVVFFKCYLCLKLIHPFCKSNIFYGCKYCSFVLNVRLTIKVQRLARRKRKQNWNAPSAAWRNNSVFPQKKTIIQICIHPLTI